MEGTGQSFGQRYNDALYLLESGTKDSVYYQLAFGLTALETQNPDKNAVNFLVDELPAYNAANNYDFVLNTGSLVPTALHFGVSDGIFSDNSGAYLITINQIANAVHEPRPWAMMILGLGALGSALRRRRSRMIDAVEGLGSDEFTITIGRPSLVLRQSARNPRSRKPPVRPRLA